MADQEILNPAQIAEKGEEIYKAKLRTLLEPKENGRFVAIDVVSEDYFLGDTIIEAVNKAREKYRDRIFHTIRVGYQGVFKMGGYAKNPRHGWNI